MSDVAEYSYRSKDVLYEVYLPSWATRPKELRLKLVNPEDKKDDIRVCVKDLEVEPTLSVLEQLAVDAQSELSKPSATLWTGEFNGRPAVRRTTTGLWSWLSHAEKGSLMVDSIFVGLSGRVKGYAAGTISKVVEGGSPEAERDLLSMVTPVCDVPAGVRDGLAVYQVRGFGVSVDESWDCGFHGIGETHDDDGPTRLTPWEDEEQVPGYKVRWDISGVVPDLDARIRSTKQHYGLGINSHGPTGLALPPAAHGPTPADYLIVDVPGVEHEKVPSRGMHGKDVLVDNPANKYGCRVVVGWFRIGQRGGCSVVIRVENEVLERWEPLWPELVSSIKIERGQ